MIGFARLSPISRARAPEGGKRAGGAARPKPARSVAAAAYRHGMALRDEAGVLADYTRRQQPEAHGLTARDPGGVIQGWTQTGPLTPHQAAEIGALWNAVERSEVRKDARLAVDWVVALPHEATPGDRAEMAGQMAAALTQRHGVAVAWAIHRPDPGKGDERNVHVHLMATTREAIRGPEGWTLGTKRRDLDQKQSLAAFKKDAAAILDDWAQRTGQPHEQRAAARDALRGYKQADAHLPEGLRRRGTEHLGPALAAMERAGEQTAKGARNQEQRRANAATIDARRAAADADAAARRVADRLRAGPGPGPRKPAAQATSDQAPMPKAAPAHPEQQAPQDRHARRDQRPEPPPQDQTERHRENGPHAGQQQRPRDDDAPRPGERRRPDLPPIRDLPAYLAWTIRMECRDNDADRARAQAGRIRALAWAVETLGPKEGAAAYRAAYDVAMQRLGIRGPEAARVRAQRDAVLSGAIKESGATAAAPAPLTAWAGAVLDRAAEIHRRQPLDAFTPWGWHASTARAQGLPGKSRTERETEHAAARLAALLRMWQEQAARQDDRDAAPPPCPTDDDRRRAAEAAAWARVWRFNTRQRDGPSL